MADLTLTCSKCQAQTVVSEYAEPGAAICSACGTPLEMPAKKEESGLRIRRMDPASQTSLTGEQMAIDLATRAQAGAQTEDVLREVHKARTKVQAVSPAWFWLVLLGLGGGWIGWLYSLAHGSAPELPFSYETARSVMTAIGWLAVLVVAFQESGGQGMLCLLLPFYILYYAFVRMEYHLLRGWFLAICLALVAEVYFIPDRSALNAAQTATNDFIAKVGGLIHRASDAPSAPPPSKLTRKGVTRPKKNEPFKPTRRPGQ